jgi:hypothetical protein
MLPTFLQFRQVAQKVFLKPIIIEKPALNVGLSQGENTASIKQIPFLNALENKTPAHTNYDLGTTPTEKGALTVSNVNDFYMGEPL